MAGCRRRRTNPAAGNGIDWSALPKDILFSIVERCIASFSDLAAFSSVCRSWRTVALAANISPNRFPPLLLSRGKRKRLWRVHDPAAPSCPGRIHRHRIPESGDIVGCSCGRLLLTDNSAITVFDPLSGEAFRSPPFPAAPRGSGTRLVTAILLNSSTLLVLNYFRYIRETFLLQWRIGAEEWTSEHHISSTFNSRPNCITALADGRIFTASFSRIFSLRLEPQPKLDEIAPLPPVDHLSDGSLKYLVSCSEAVVYLDLVLSGNQYVVRAFRLVESATGAMPEWVQVGSLADSAIFLTPLLNIPPMACQNPENLGREKRLHLFCQV